MVQARTGANGFTAKSVNASPHQGSSSPHQARRGSVAGLGSWAYILDHRICMSACLFLILLRLTHQPTCHHCNPIEVRQVRERFATKGYVIFYGAVHDDTINVWRSIARQTDGWFEEEVNDMTEEKVRVKAAVPDKDAREMSRLLKRFYRAFFPVASAHDWHFIKIAAGTEAQPPRREFLTVPLGADIMDTIALPGSIVVATSDDTCFYAYGWNERCALRSNRKLLELNKGDIVLFRGDFILAPDEYDSNNICLHAYLDSPCFDRPDDHRPTVVTEIDDTRGINAPSCIVWNCTLKGTPLSLRRHLNRSHGIRFQRAARHIEQ